MGAGFVHIQWRARALPALPVLRVRAAYLQWPGPIGSAVAARAIVASEARLCVRLSGRIMLGVGSLWNNVQRFFYHSDDVTAMALLIRMQQGMDGSWAELNKPPTLLIKSEWEKFAAYNKGVHTPSETA